MHRLDTQIEFAPSAERVWSILMDFPAYPRWNPLIRPIASPYGEETVYAVPPLRPDISIVHAQRASARGDTQVWGLLGCQKEAAFAQRFADERDVSLTQISNAAVDQFRRTARRSFAEIMLFQQKDRKPARRRIERAAGARRTAADDDNVPGLIAF